MPRVPVGRNQKRGGFSGGRFPARHSEVSGREQFGKNLELVEAIRKLAEGKGITNSQLALAWVISKSIVPIPGTKRRKYVEENIAAAGIQLSSEDLAQLESIIPLGTITGDRYDEAGMNMVNL